MYERLLFKDTQNPARTDLDSLTEQWAEVTNQLVQKRMKDPHDPKAPFLTDAWNPGGDLEYEETIGVMKLVVNAMLQTKLLSLGCNSLGQLVDFSKDEASRMKAVSAISGGQRILGDAGVRIQVAASRLALHRAQNS
jgi:hypothetical protein